MEPAQRVGIVGCGQLAVMMADAAERLGLEVDALARCPDDPIFTAGRRARVGDSRSLEDLRTLAAGTDVLTFDHELIDHRVLAQLEREGVVIRPGSMAMAIATNKERQFGLFEYLALAQPETVVVSDLSAALNAIEKFDRAAVLKTATGGYDGRGVLLDSSEAAVSAWFPVRQTSVLVQRRVDVETEIAVQVVRAYDGSVVAYAPARTVQSNGMCSVVHVPAEVSPELEQKACACAKEIAEAIDVVGLLTVEFFVAKGELVVNELAARPHNSGHLTIEACQTSQFENHMRAVAGLPLGPTDFVVPAAAMANIVGPITAKCGSDAAGENVAVHLYGKTPRPGRKLGHVTATAESTSKAIGLALDAVSHLHDADKQDSKTETENS